MEIYPNKSLISNELFGQKTSLFKSARKDSSLVKKRKFCPRFLFFFFGGAKVVRSLEFANPQTRVF
jgi:hypothetical protein